MQAAKRTPVDLKEWAVSLIERDNRKSHLAPQLSPATRELLRGEDSPNSQTPTSGDIPIGGGDVRSAIASPQYDNYSSRSPTKNGHSSSVGRSSGAAMHPGLVSRATTNSVPKLTTLNTPDGGANGPSSANAASFGVTTLPIRPAAPSGPLPPPPSKKPDDLDPKSRRQATFGNGLYGSQQYGNGSGA